MTFEITRRSFLRGLLALSASAAIPKELVKFAEYTYSDNKPLKKSPVYILINGKIAPIVSCNVIPSLPEFTPIYVPKGMGNYEKICGIGSTSQSDEVEIKFLSNKYQDEFFYRLRKFDFEIVYEDLPCNIKGIGYASSISIDSILNRNDEPSLTTFVFQADINQYDITKDNCEI